MMAMPEREVYDAWADYLENVRGLLKRRILAKSRKNERYRSLDPLVDDVIDEMHNARPFIEHAIDQTDPPVRDFLGRELVFFNDLAAGLESNPSDDDDSDGTDTADTIKESVEKVFHIHIPEKIKHILDILNELLKLLH